MTCPKCNGTDYFLSTRTVMKGIGGIYGNRGGTKKFPVCKTCDEIMSQPQPTFTDNLRNPKIQVLMAVFLAVVFFLYFFELA